MSTRTLAIMFTDIKGFTARTSEDSREEIVHLLDEHDHLLRPVFAHFRGQIVKTIGDAFLVTFESPTDAVVCGVTVQEVLRKHNAVAKDADKIEVRVSINIGDVELRTDAATGALDVFGEAVNLAARLESITNAGEVWFTEAVYLTMNRHETPTSEIGERTFKGILQPVKVFKVVFDPPSESLQKIIDAISVVDGRPVLSGLPGPKGGALAFPAPHEHREKTGRALTLPMALGGAAVLIAVVALGLIWSSNAAQAKALADLRAAVETGKYEQAVSLADSRLAKKSDPEVLSLGLRAEEAMLDEKIRDAGPSAAMDWAHEEMRSHPWSSGMRGRMSDLDTRVVMLPYLNGKAGFPEEEIEKLLHKYPDDASVPYTVARFCEAGSGMRQYCLKYFEMALERGGYKGDEHVREACEQTFDDFGLRAAWTETCQRIEKKFYPKERVLWAEKHLDAGSANEFQNAWEILHDEKRSEADDAFRHDLRDFLAGSKDEALSARILALTDPLKRKRAIDLIAGSIKTMSVGPVDADRFEEFLAKLKKGGS